MKKISLFVSLILASSLNAAHHEKVELGNVDKCYMKAIEKYPGHVISM